MLCWRLIETYPRKEEAAAFTLSSGSIDYLLPRYQERRVNEFSGSVSYYPRPLFPGYIFAYSTLEQFEYLRKPAWIFRQFVRFGNEIATVDDEIIETLMARIDNGYVKLYEAFEDGQRVRVVAGPCSGIEGVFEADKSSEERVSILLTVSFQCSIQVERELVRAIA